MTVNVGVIGVGMIGQDHIRRLTTVLAGANVVAVSDVNALQAQEAASRLTGAKVYPTGEDLIDAKEVEAVIVTSWGPTHSAYVLAAIKAGKPVFCEKPLATTEADCSAIIDAEVAFGRRLVQVGFMRRFDPQYLAMKETIASGAIGLPLMFQSVHRNASVPAHYTGEMALTDTAVHDIDVAQFLLDDEPITISVRAPGATVAPATWPIRLSLSSKCAWARWSSSRLRSISPTATTSAARSSARAATVSLAERNEVVVKANGAFSGRVPVDWRDRFAAAFDAEFRAWLTAAAKGGAAGPSAWDGYVATAATLAGVGALESGAREAISFGRSPRSMGPNPGVRSVAASCRSRRPSAGRTAGVDPEQAFLLGLGTEGLRRDPTVPEGSDRTVRVDPAHNFRP